jgi:hypothetical protein
VQFHGICSCTSHVIEVEVADRVGVRPGADLEDSHREQGEVKFCLSVGLNKVVICCSYEVIKDEVDPLVIHYGRVFY